jgi:hypothetical protein
MTRMGIIGIWLAGRIQLPMKYPHLVSISIGVELLGWGAFLVVG